MKLQVAGENAIMVRFADEISASVSQQVQRCVFLLDSQLADVIIDLVPSYASVLVLFDPLQYSHADTARLIREAMNSGQVNAQATGREVNLPVYYAEESGPDLAAMAERASLSIEQFIEVHTAVAYRVYAIGFAPGFGYLGEVDARIAAPRQTAPRARVPAGAVGIADRQTAIYPAASPGGWNLIGLCPTPMFNPKGQPPMPFTVEDTVRFTPITREDYLAQGGSLS